jgi:hypothetical protein
VIMHIMSESQALSLMVVSSPFDDRLSTFGQ